ncbi:MAG TPA: MFS transporter [Acidimicrobiia bacterium]|nr:MFS transporter [Acidimicrobiia bacterium]
MTPADGVPGGPARGRDGGDQRPVRRPPVVTPFARLARTHALMAAGDAVIAIALAGSLFFDISPGAARTKVALYLIFTMLPFTIVAPLVGPAIDRMAGGRRAIVMACALGKTVVSIFMITHLDGLALFPLAFTTLVFSKAYAVCKSALVPSLVRNDKELVEANSKLGLLAGIVGFAAALPAVIFQLISPQATVAFSALIFGLATFVAWQIPRHIVIAAEREAPVEAAELRSGGIRLAASAMGLLRAVVGFLTFQIAFWFRNTGTPTAWFGVVLVFSAIGTLAGNAVGPLVRQQLKEERMLIAALGLTAVGGTIAAIFGGRPTAALLSAIVGFGAALARLAFDSIVQRDAPDANRGRAFARFETRFQLGWVAAAAVPVIIPIPGWLGFAIVGAISAFAMVSYVGGARYLRQRGELPEKLSRRAWRELQRRRALRQTGAGTPLPPPSPPGQ